MVVPYGGDGTRADVGSQSADSIKFYFRIQQWPVLKWRVAYFGQYPSFNLAD